MAEGSEVVGQVEDELAKLPAETPLPARSDAAFDRIASVVQKVLGVPVALVSLVDRTQQVFPGAVGLPDPVDAQRATPLSHSFCQYVVRDASPLVVVDARENALVAENGAVRDLGVVAYAGMPLIDLGGRVAGSLCAIDTKPRNWTTEELSLLADLAAACAAELQLRGSVAQANRASERWRISSELSETLASATSIDEVSRFVGELSIEHLDATFGGLVLVDDVEGSMHFVDLGSFPAIVQERRTFSLWSNRPAAIAARTRRPLYFETVDELVHADPQAREATLATGGNAFAYVPIFSGDRVLGTLAFVWSEPRSISVDDRELLEGVARFSAQAIERAQLLAERRDVARTLQAVLMPEVPDVDWLQIAAQYHPAHSDDEVGGDWFDAFENEAEGDGTRAVTIVIGDVMGHDTAAAAVMGQMQATVRALAIDRPCVPSELLRRLDNVMEHSKIDRMATALAATVEQLADSGARFTWSNAGHLPPLVLVPGRSAHFADREPELLLGMDSNAARSSGSVDLPSGSTVLLFTDGLVELPGTDIEDGLSRLSQLADAMQTLPLTSLTERLAMSVEDGANRDDIVVLGLRIP